MLGLNDWVGWWISWRRSVKCGEHNLGLLISYNSLPNMCEIFHLGETHLKYYPLYSFSLFTPPSLPTCRHRPFFLPISPCEQPQRWDIACGRRFPWASSLQMHSNVINLQEYILSFPISFPHLKNVETFSLLLYNINDFTKIASLFITFCLNYAISVLFAENK